LRVKAKHDASRDTTKSAVKVLKFNTSFNT